MTIATKVLTRRLLRWGARYGEREPARLATSHCSGFLLYSKSHYTPTNLIVKPSRSDKIFLYALIKELVFYSPSTVSWR
ncbi:hypothetical protein EFP23_01460 [Lacticaseibacillus paracasei]|nr:hypothetical protein [Lacticaseibacillus paracasei]MCT3343329.1 hypothetical protein [Lacticaseibacillus paracasei]QHC82338.1 hypothetical protein F5J09_11585 [Lacticaseibacillus paracasei]RDF84961.1 hypothetical protein DQM24_03900 [Lacticaseibacillus paracasei]